MAQKERELKSILATDCGSTTTKAILIEYVDGEYRLIQRGEAPTTVEAPFEDVTKGVLNAVEELEDLTGRKFLENDKILVPQEGNAGVDIYISTSSAGGGLQMMVAAVVKTMTTESAQRAALGAGAIVMDALASNDGRLPHEKVERIRHLRPDMILLGGGIDGGTISHVVEMAELIGAADPKARLGMQYKLPVIYAGNIDARSEVKEILEEKVALYVVDNLRPVLERENLMPARHKIHDLFMEHVMANAPGYNKLMKWTEVPIMPTPGAVGAIIETIAKQNDIEVVGVDIGGATTDVFSVFKDPKEGKPIFNRTVSANLGMSYSISNVLAESGLSNVMRWVPLANIDDKELRNTIKNKMIRPTTIPQSLEELIIEQAIAREALRLAFKQHKSLAVGLKGVQQERTIADAFDQSESGLTLVNLMNLNMLVGSGGVLSHAPRRNQSAMMLVDAFLPEGITELAVDSIFMMPQLGVLSTVHARAATEVFEKDCLIHLGTCIAPIGKTKNGQECMTVELQMPDGRKLTEIINYGDMKLIKMPFGKKAKVVVTPAKNFDMGEGKGKEFEAEINGGVTGIILDGRGRQPFHIPEDRDERIASLRKWHKALDIYPDY